MSTWDEKEIGTEECDNCGAMYSVSIKQFPLRDKDKFVCSCGNVMREWNSTSCYFYERIS